MLHATTVTTGRSRLAYLDGSPCPHPPFSPHLAVDGGRQAGAHDPTTLSSVLPVTALRVHDYY